MSHWTHMSQRPTKSRAARSVANETATPAQDLAQAGVSIGSKSEISNEPSSYDLENPVVSLLCLLLAYWTAAFYFQPRHYALGVEAVSADQYFDFRWWCCRRYAVVPIAIAIRQLEAFQADTARCLVAPQPVTLWLQPPRCHCSSDPQGDRRRHHDQQHPSNYRREVAHQHEEHWAQDDAHSDVRGAEPQD